jgi:hypothetical protein
MSWCFVEVLVLLPTEFLKKTFSRISGNVAVIRVKEMGNFPRKANFSTQSLNDIYIISFWHGVEKLASNCALS